MSGSIIVSKATVSYLTLKVLLHYSKASFLLFNPPLQWWGPVIQAGLGIHSHLREELLLDRAE